MDPTFPPMFNIGSFIDDFVSTITDKATNIINELEAEMEALLIGRLGLHTEASIAEAVFSGACVIETGPDTETLDDGTLRTTRTIKIIETWGPHTLEDDLYIGE